MTELMTIQTKLKAPKGKFNSFGKYRYRSCEDILEAVKALLAETKTTLTLNDEIVQLGDRYYIRRTATLMNSKGDIMQTTAYAREAETKAGMDASQITGTASSYRRKYALNGLFAIDDNADPDTDEYQIETKRKAAAKAPPKSENKRKKDPAPTDGADDGPRCEVCGKPVSDKIAARSKEVFGGHIFCSKECASSVNDGQKGENK